MKVLVACERSGVVRRAFQEVGCSAYSCDLEPADDGEKKYHLQMDALQAVYSNDWDLLIGHPECTFLANSGSKHLYEGMKKENGPNPERWARLGAAAHFFNQLYTAPIPKIAIENPVMLGHAKILFNIPHQTQTIQPWQFGHGVTKATCLWLKNLPNLTPTNIVDERSQELYLLPPSKERKRLRSVTFEGIAKAMAEQWGRERKE